MPWSSPSRREADAEASPFPSSFPGFPRDSVRQEPDALIVSRHGLRRSHPTSTPTQQLGYANLTMCVSGPAAGTLGLCVCSCAGAVCAFLALTKFVAYFSLCLEAAGASAHCGLTQRLHSDRGSVSTGVEIGFIESDTVRGLGRRIAGAFLSLI